MKKVWALMMALMLLVCGCAAAEQSKLSFEAETVLMPGLQMEMSVPAGMRYDYMKDATSLIYQMEYDEGIRYSGQNEDVGVTVSMTNFMDEMSFDEYVAKVYDESVMGYHSEEITLAGGKAYRVWRDAESNSNGYILCNETEETDPSLVYAIFITTYTEKGEAMRDEILASLRSISIQ